jgi:hypothetical protein
VTRSAYPEWLGAELVAAARRRSERSPAGRFVPAAAAGVAAMAVAIVAMVGGADRAAAGVLVEVRDGAVQVLVEDLEARPDDIELAVRRAGIDLDVVTVPVGPSRVGRFVRVHATAPLPPDVSVTVGDRETFVGFAVPAGYDDSIKLALGRTALPDEPYAGFSDAFAPGEPLHCRSVLRASPGDAMAALTITGLRVRWLAVGREAVPIAARQAVTTYREWRVAFVSALSAEEMVVGLTPDGAWAQSSAAGHDDGCGAG